MIWEWYVTKYNQNWGTEINTYCNLHEKWFFSERERLVVDSINEWLRYSILMIKKGSSLPLVSIHR
mgnify:CR=1 FL=1